MTQKRYRIGVMFSTTGSYSVVARSILNGALLAFQEVNASGGDIVLEPVVVNPSGDLARYRSLSLELLGSGIRQVVGCYTSSSRKEVIPCFEKFDGLLWYPSHYEGFESSDNVIYTGAAPNQHVLPLVDYLASRVGSRAFCVAPTTSGPWENNRIFREALIARGGAVLAERYLPVGDTEVDQVIAAIIDQRPHCVFNNLIGTSACAFFRAFRAACRARGIDQASRNPGRELHAVGAGIAGNRPGRGRRSPVLECLFLLAKFSRKMLRSFAPIRRPFRTGRSRRQMPNPPTSPSSCSQRHWHRPGLTTPARCAPPWPINDFAPRKEKSASTGRPFMPGSRHGSAARPPTGSSRCCWNPASRSRPIRILFSRRRALPARCALRC